MRSAFVIVIGLLAAACANSPAPRPLASGFGAEAGVADPYADGKRHLAAANYELALQRFGQALAHDRRSLDALNGLAIAYTHLGRFDSARSQFERALQIDPTNAVTLNNYGWSLIEQGRLREAKAFLELALQHAAEAEAPVVAANIERIRGARPPALVAALEEHGEPKASAGPHRLVRVDDNAYLLETTGEPPAPPSAAHDAPRSETAPQRDAAAVALPAPRPHADARSAPEAAAHDVGVAGPRRAAAAHVGPAEPKPAIPLRPASGAGPIRLWPQPPSGSEAGTILPGDDE